MVVTRQLSRLKELWGERKEMESLFQPKFVEGTLGEGWNLVLDNGHEFHLITDSEIFGWERPQARQHLHVTYQAPESSYADLNPGDWVVHVDYGIGRFSGLVRRRLEGVEREFLCVEYDGGDQLYVPITSRSVEPLYWP